MKNLSALVLMSWLVGACATPTPQSRIDASPEKFTALSAKTKALVLEGNIERGMTQDAVLLAWGPPASRFEGLKNGRPTERWEYAGARPIHDSGINVGDPFDYSGTGYSRRYSPYGYRGEIGPDIIYIPYTRASVLFVGGRVADWERKK